MVGLFRHVRSDPVALHQNMAHGFAAKHALVHFPSGAIYTFIPKNACSTMRVSLAVAHGCISGPEDWAWIHSNNKTFQAELRDLIRSKYSFVILRCPYARLASVFLDKIAGKSIDFWELHRRTGDGFDPDTITFRDFAKLMSIQKYRRANPHWRPQVEFLIYEDYTYWIALEQFSKATTRLTADIGLDVVDARSFTRHGTDHLTQVDTGCFADTPACEIATMRRAGRVPAHDRLYDAEIRESVGQTYRTDRDLYVEKFGSEGLLFQTP